MSKHKPAEAKLHVKREVRQTTGPISRDNEPAADGAPQIPHKGTNSNNQYR